MVGWADGCWGTWAKGEWFRAVDGSLGRRLDALIVSRMADLKGGVGKMGRVIGVGFWV